MFLQLNHQKLEVFQVSRKFLLECYDLTKSFPPDEKYNLTTQIRRAALSVHLNIAEGSSRKSSAERRRYYEISRGSIIEIDAALDVAFDLGHFKMENCKSLPEVTTSCFKLLSKLINSTASAT
ncbi:MAG TPA: four helix bundle protein [Chitinophagales bacterium]|nr:four helix bundle protein [Chitinophagales bacterium]